MPKMFYNRVKETTASTGTGDITLLGAATQYVSFSSRYAVGELFYYCIAGQSGSEWEVGKGTLAGASTLVRVSVSESSNSDNIVDFSAGVKDVFVTVAASRMSKVPTNGRALANASGNAMI